MAKFSQKSLVKSRFSILIFYFLVFLLPFQVKRTFFTENSFYYGFHAFYNTFFFYLTDLLILGLIIAWICEKASDVSREKKLPNLFFQNIRVCWEALLTVSKHVIQGFFAVRVYQLMLAFWLIMATSLIFSRENTIGIYGLYRITLVLAVFAFIKENISHEKNLILWILVISGAFQGLLAGFQYLTQSSLGLGVLGEEFLKPGIAGVAKFATHGIANQVIYEFFPYLSTISNTSVVMRAYGTFPHPNILAVFLFTGMMINLCLLYYAREKLKIAFLLLTLVLLTTGLVVTFSRLAWIIAFLGIVIWLVGIFFGIRVFHRQAMESGSLRESNSGYRPGQLLVIFSVLIASFVLNWFVFGTQIKDRLRGPGVENISISESYLDRKTYGNIAWQMFLANPVLGVGLRNFVVEMDTYTKNKLLPHQHQPAHSIYLLLLAEAGVLALVSFALLVINIVRRVFKSRKTLLGQTLLLITFGNLFLGFFDHYFLSLHQGSLMFWLVLGLISCRDFWT